jgi:outer membrane receptor protein involved in Fe transport
VQTTNPIGLRWSSFVFCAQDTWAATKNLTLTYGVRYENYTLPVHDHAGPYQYDPSIRTMVTDVTGTHTVATVLIGDKENTPQNVGISALD